MPSANLRPDVSQIAFRLLQEATGERPKILPPSERMEKNPEAVTHGRRGGKKGGKARAKKLGARRLKASAKKAARQRCKKQSA